MRRGARVLVAAALALGVAGGGAAAADRLFVVTFEPYDNPTGGVVNLDTGRTYRNSDAADGTVTMVPFRPGGRFQVPVLLMPRSGDVPVVVESVRLVTAAGSVVRQVGTWRSLTPYVMDDAVPLAPTRVPLDAPRARAELYVGIDVQMSATAPPEGWTERLRGVRVTYRRHGFRHTTYRPFHGQTVYVRG